jgi:hypothetical protein
MSTCWHLSYESTGCSSVSELPESFFIPDVIGGRQNIFSLIYRKSYNNSIIQMSQLDVCTCKLNMLFATSVKWKLLDAS